MDVYLIVLRLIHILGGVFWAGAAFALTGFVGPAVNQAGPEGGKVMQRLVLGTRWVTTVSAAAGLAVLTGLLLYWRASGGLQQGWITTGSGIIFTIGGVAGLIGLFYGIRVGGTSRELAKLGQNIGASGGPPSPEQATELAGLQERLGSMGTINAIALVITVLAMATARYVAF
jgi:uncharacterized membrane protein